MSWYEFDQLVVICHFFGDSLHCLLKAIVCEIVWKKVLANDHDEISIYIIIKFWKLLLTSTF